MEGWNIPESAAQLVRAARSNPAATAMAATAVAVYGIHSHYSRKSLARLEASNQAIAAMVAASSSECKVQLSRLEQVVGKDLRARDDLSRRLEVQNVEQTRSVNRLQHALRSCAATPAPQVPSQVVPTPDATEVAPKVDE